MLHHLDSLSQRNFILFSLTLILPLVCDAIEIICAEVKRHTIQGWRLYVVNTHLESLQISDANTGGNQELFHLF